MAAIRPQRVAALKYEIYVDGRPIEVDPADERSSVEETEPGVYSVLLNGVQYEVRVAGTLVQIAGRQHRIEVIDPRSSRASGDTLASTSRQNIAAPMPGKVVRLLVAKGDAVEAGQALVVVEAMKMQNEMKASHAGTVCDIRSQAGDTVAAGDILLVIE